MRILMKTPLLLLFALASCLTMPGQDSETTQVIFNRITNNQNTNASDDKNKEEAVGDIKVRMGDRWYVYNTMLSVFGPDSKTQLTNNILKQVGIFGGPCDEQELSAETMNSLEFEDLNCFSSSLSTNMMLPSSVLREGWRIKACEESVDSDTSLDFVADKITESKTADDLDLNADTMTKAYNMFQPGRALSEEQVLALTNLADSFGDNREKWRHVVLVMCIDPIWQIP